MNTAELTFTGNTGNLALFSHLFCISRDTRNIQNLYRSEIVKGNTLMVYFTTILSRVRQILQEKQKNSFEKSIQYMDTQKLYQKIQEDKADMTTTFILPNYLKYEFN